MAVDIDFPEREAVKHNIFYLPPENINNYRAIITGDDVHYLLDVMRAGPEEVLQFTDGKGGLYEASITNRRRNKVELKIRNRRSYPRADRSVALAFVPLKGSRSDYILEKATELGVDEFFIFSSKNSVMIGISENKMSRFKNIVKQAMLQSRRFFLPSITELEDIEGIIRQFGKYEQVLILHTDGAGNISAGRHKDLIVVGPEGGFDKSETTLFRGHGAQIVSLGDYRLRSETAAITAVALTLIPRP